MAETFTEFTLGIQHFSILLEKWWGFQLNLIVFVELFNSLGLWVNSDAGSHHQNPNHNWNFRTIVDWDSAVALFQDFVG